MKNRVIQLLCFSMSVLLIGGCIEGEDTNVATNNANNGTNGGLTKEQARETKDDVVGRDLCEEYSWYGDGECDDFCVLYDEADCAEEPACTSDADCESSEACIDGVCATEGAFCGGIAGILCPEGQYCANEVGVCGIADQSGTCAPIPSGCTEEYAPVCGCDGKTYSNACEAATVGASIQAEGACGTQACVDSSTCATGEQCVDGACLTQCGGRLGATCDESEYCAYVPVDMCGAADASSVCLPRPEICNKRYAPVCGCDQVTYGNACQANEAGQGIMSEGACETNAACGTRGGTPCPEGQFCEFDITAACGATDQGGSCEALPTACPDVYLPVCGCDQQTYGNECEANAAGVSVSSKGACVDACATVRCASGSTCVEGVCVPAAVCGGLLGLLCDANHWCDYPETTVCGQADFQGTCVLRPQACLQVYDPVCGCDGQDYGNACTANAAGVDVMASGTCGF